MEGNELKGFDASNVEFLHQLKSYCTNLLYLLQNPKKNDVSVTRMADFLRQAPADALQPCVDYALFPLLLLLDADIQCRSVQNIDSKEMPNVPHIVNDSVAEGVLLCLEEILGRCSLTSVNQMSVILKKLASGAMLLPSKTSEEFREGIIRCLRALFTSLRPCSRDTCVCKEISKPSTSLVSCSLQKNSVCTPSGFVTEDCLLAFLLSHDAAPAIGHWLSLLFKSAESEVARGLHGSGNLRIEAFLTLRILFAKVGTADALSFFLPGVVSHFAKVLHLSKSMISGAAGNTESVNHALRGLVDFLMITLSDKSNTYNHGIAIDISKDNMGLSVLDALRHFPVNPQVPDGYLPENSFGIFNPHEDTEKERMVSQTNICMLRVSRTKQWIEETSIQVDKLLSSTFPCLCVHPAIKVREALVEGIGELLFKCKNTMERSRLMLLECLFTLVYDDCDSVSIAAQNFLGRFFKMNEKYLVENEIATIFSRLIEQLPKVVLGSQETMAVSHAQRMLAVMYYAGPQLVVDHLLHSPTNAVKLFEVLALALSQSSLFAGSANKFIATKSLSIGFLPSIAELESSTQLVRKNIANSSPALVSEYRGCQERKTKNLLESGMFQLPRVPPWFVHVGNKKFYEAVAGILRLTGLSIMSDPRNVVELCTIVDIPLNAFRKLESELRLKEFNKESWKAWYSRTGSGWILRQACTAACILNEIIYGTSDRSATIYANLFLKSKMQTENQSDPKGNKCENTTMWKKFKGKEEVSLVVDCVRSILHEYLSPELWSLPTSHNSTIYAEPEDLSLHFFQDVIMLHQVIIEGIGIFNLSLGRDFVSSGFLHSSLYVLLENLICSNYEIKSTADFVLHVISSSVGHDTVGQLVVANADYIIDSLCRQLRHLDVSPYVPDVLTAMLSCIGAAHDILPLLEEPMRSVSSQLEVLGRHQHPYLTIPFLKAVREITKVARIEASTLPNKYIAFYSHVKSILSDYEKAKSSLKQNDDIDNTVLDSLPSGASEKCINHEATEMHTTQLEEILFKLEKLRSYRRTVGSIAGSCIVTASPLVASMKETACLLALSIIEDGIATIAQVEEAYRHEKASIEAINQVLHRNHDLQDAEVTDGTDENRLLPAANKIWPHLVICLKSNSLVAIKRCTNVVSTVVRTCGGDFFTRRFHTDGHHFWKFLSSSPFLRNPLRKEETQILLPYRSISKHADEPVAEISILKVQESVLTMIADISKNKASASALGAVLKKVSGFVVSVACSGILSLRNASIDALQGLSCIDPDLIWLLLADIVYSLKNDHVSPPLPDLPEIAQILPPPASTQQYLYVQYRGENLGFKVDISSAEYVFEKLCTWERCTQEHNRC